MSVTRVDRDTEDLTLTLIADFDGIPVEQVWELWADPRQLERWWGPPTYPATMEEHDLTPGGTVTYFMTSPEGERHRGWWRITAVDPPARWSSRTASPTRTGRRRTPCRRPTIRVTLAERDGGTRMQLTLALRLA